MANIILFIEKPVHHESIGEYVKITYCYNTKGQMTVFRKGQKVAERCNVKPGDALVVASSSSKTTIEPLRVPHSNRDLMMWILHFRKETRAHNREEYDQLVVARARNYSWWGYRQYVTEGEGYTFTSCQASNGVARLAGLIERPLDKELVKELMTKFVIRWPRYFVEDLLRNRFGFTDNDLAELAANPDVDWSC